jgi:non-ribosomal peptide synthetase component F
MTLAALVSHQAAARPQDAAFIEGAREIRFADLDLFTRRAAAWLRAQGIGPGDRVALWFPNRLEWLVHSVGQRMPPRRVGVSHFIRSTFRLPDQRPAGAQALR